MIILDHDQSQFVIFIVVAEHERYQSPVTTYSLIFSIRKKTSVAERKRHRDPVTTDLLGALLAVSGRQAHSQCLQHILYLIFLEKKRSHLRKKKINTCGERPTIKQSVPTTAIYIIHNNKHRERVFFLEKKKKLFKIK